MRLKYLKDTGLTFGMIELTPELATECLGNMAANRRPSKSMISKYANTFKPGTTIYQPLIFNEAGQLMDGQHRCQAVIQSKTAIHIATIGNVPSSAWDDLDGGKTRSLADVLAAMGEQYSQTVASIVTAIHQYEVGYYCGVDSCPPRQRALEIFDRHATKIRDAAIWLGAHGAIRGVMPPSIAAFVYFMTGGASEQLEPFWSKVETGVGVRSKFDPAALLRNRLVNDRNGKSRLPRETKIALTIKAVNSALTNQPLQVLRWSNGEEFPQFLIEYGRAMKATA